MELDAVVQAVARAINLTMESVARKDLTRIHDSRRIAALPLDVRKGSAIPKSIDSGEMLCLPPAFFGGVASSN
jgi:hypothetical protein